MKTRSALLILLILFAVSCNQQSSNSDNNAPAQSNAPWSLSEREAQLIYSRAFEAILWASPALAVMAQVEAGQRDLGAGNHEGAKKGVGSLCLDQTALSYGGLQSEPHP